MMRLQTRNIILLTCLLVVLFVMDLLIGSISYTFSNIWSLITHPHEDSTFSLIFYQFRLPRAATCVLVGASLATGGLMMQTLFRNPLAGPDVLGLTSGSGLMVAILLMGSWLSMLAYSAWGIAVAAILGAGFVFAIIVSVAKRVYDHAALLIVGLMIGATASSMVSIFQYVSQSNDLKAYTLWALGSVDGTSHQELLIMSITIFPTLIFCLTQAKSLNTFLWGENYARSMGLNIRSAKMYIIGATSILTGVATAFCGPIAFVGIAVPHLIKLIVPTSNHKVLLPYVMIGGACLMLICDLIRQLTSSVQPLPLNAITSLIGAPVVIWVVVKYKNMRYQ